MKIVCWFIIGFLAENKLSSAQWHTKYNLSRELERPYQAPNQIFCEWNVYYIKSMYNLSTNFVRKL